MLSREIVEFLLTSTALQFDSVASVAKIIFPGVSYPNDVLRLKSLKISPTSLSSPKPQGTLVTSSAFFSRILSKQ